MRKNVVTEMCMKYAYDSKAIKQIHALYLEMQLPTKVKFTQFLRILKQDETPHLRSVFEGVSGGLQNPLDVRILLIMLMNAIQSPMSKEERLKFAFNIID